MKPGGTEPDSHKKGPDDAIAGPEGTAPITVNLTTDPWRMKGERA